MKVIFFGSSDYCLPILISLTNNFQLAAAITKSDLPAGRLKTPKPTSVSQAAKTKNIPVFTPHNKAELLLLKSQLCKFAADVFLVADYGLIIPEEILTIPRLKTINIHFSRLPKLRGPSPVQYTILTGGKNAWITFMLMDRNLDTGDLLRQIDVPLMGDETAGTLYIKLFNIASLELPDLINKYANNELSAVKQDHKNATFTKLLTRDDGFVPWEFLLVAIDGKKYCADSKQSAFQENYPDNGQTKCFSSNSSEEIFLSKVDKSSPLYLAITHAPSLAVTLHRVLRAFTPWPGLWTEIALRHLRGGRMDSSKVEKSETEVRRLKILKAHLNQDKFIIDQVQLEGKNPVSWKQFAEGYPIIESSLPPR